MVDTSCKQEAENRWFAQRRDFFFTNMLKGFCRTISCFHGIYEGYLHSGEVSFDAIDYLVGSESSKGRLWRLKDNCHQFWQDADPASNLNGCLLDWVMGSAFHEAMKLKENVYLFQFYGPMAADKQVIWHREIQRVCGFDCQSFMERISREVSRQMESLGFMFGRASYLLRTMLPEQTGNALLLRFLVEQEDVVQELWFEPLEAIFENMFPLAPENGFCLAGQSYFEGNWYEKALASYNKALQINKQCDEAIRRTHHLREMLQSKTS